VEEHFVSTTSPLKITAIGFFRHVMGKLTHHGSSSLQSYLRTSFHQRATWNAQFGEKTCNF